MNYTEKRLEEFDEAFRNSSWWEDAENNKHSPAHSIRKFLSTSIQQAIAEERERVRRDISALDGHYTNVTNEKDVYERGFAVGYDTGWNDVLLKLRTALLSPQQSNPNKNI